MKFLIPAMILAVGWSSAAVAAPRQPAAADFKVEATAVEGPHGGLPTVDIRVQYTGEGEIVAGPLWVKKNVTFETPVGWAAKPIVPTRALIGNVTALPILHKNDFLTVSIPLESRFAAFTRGESKLPFTVVIHSFDREWSPMEVLKPAAQRLPVNEFRSVSLGGEVTVGIGETARIDGK